MKRNFSTEASSTGAAGRSFTTFLLMMALGTAGALAQQNATTTNPFDGVKQFSQGATEIKDVDLDKHALDVAGSLDKQMPGAMGNMDAVSVHKYGFPKAGLYNMAEVKKYVARLDRDGWKQMVYKQDADGITEVATRDVDNGEAKEMAVVKAEPKELKFVYLRYHGSLANLSGMEGLDGKADGSADPKLQQRAH